MEFGNIVSLAFKNDDCGGFGTERRELLGRNRLKTWDGEDQSDGSRFYREEEELGALASLKGRGPQGKGSMGWMQKVLCGKKVS